MQDPKPFGIDHEGGPDFYNAPLKSDGSDYPCKGFHLTAGMGLPEKQWKAGSIETFTYASFPFSAWHSIFIDEK